MSAHDYSEYEYTPVPEPPKTGVTVAIILCALLIGAAAVYHMVHGGW